MPPKYHTYMESIKIENLLKTCQICIPLPLLIWVFCNLDYLRPCSFYIGNKAIWFKIYSVTICLLKFQNDFVWTTMPTTVGGLRLGYISCKHCIWEADRLQDCT